MTAKDGFVCKEQFLSNCPYGPKGCTVSAQFVGQQVAELSYKYKTKSMKRDDMQKALEKAYGTGQEDSVQIDTKGREGEWITRWTAGRASITIRRINGVNKLGERYDDTWLIFTDKAFTLFTP